MLVTKKILLGLLDDAYGWTVILSLCLTFALGYFTNSQAHLVTYAIAYFVFFIVVALTINDIKNALRYSIERQEQKGK